MRGFKPGIDGVCRLVVRVTHGINDQGSITKIECELNALANDLIETDEDFGVEDVVECQTEKPARAEQVMAGGAMQGGQGFAGAAGTGTGAAAAAGA